MTLLQDALSSAPDGPPLVSIERQGHLLRVTVLHPAAADLLWLLRERLTAIHDCTGLQLTVHGSEELIELQWQRPAGPHSDVSVPQC